MIETKIIPFKTSPPDKSIKGEILARVRRAGTEGYLVLHYACGGGEEQQPFDGWFYWAGCGFAKIATRDIIGWVRIEDLWKNI